MRIIVWDTLYQSSLDQIEISISDVGVTNFEDIKKLYQSYKFGTSGTYEYYLTNSNTNVLEIISNSALLQNMWAQENLGTSLHTAFWENSLFVKDKIVLYKIFSKLRHFHWVLLKQIEFYRPDVLLIKDIHYYPLELLSRIRNMGTKLVGFISSVQRNDIDLTCFDLLVSSVPSILQAANIAGVQNFQMFPSFDARNLEYISSKGRDIDCSFVGSLHTSSIDMLLAAQKVFANLRIYSPSTDFSKLPSLLRANYAGQAFGRDMYKVFGRSQITLNRHGLDSKNFSGNNRLFEATGMGACTLTEDTPLLSDLFPNNAIASYRSLGHMQEVLSELKGKPISVRSISKCGQDFTLLKHDTRTRMEELRIRITNL